MHTIGKKKKRWFLSKFRLLNSGPGNAANCILETPILPISRGGMSPDARRSSCLRHSTFAPAARTVHVRQLNHCIRYFQMPPKTLKDRNKKAYQLTLIWNQLNFTLLGWGSGCLDRKTLHDLHNQHLQEPIEGSWHLLCFFTFKIMDDRYRNP